MLLVSARRTNLVPLIQTITEHGRNSDASTVGGVQDEISRFADRTQEQYTNYASAIEGAYQDFTRSGSEDACRMLVTFTDGALTAQEGADVAEAALCAPGGVTDRLRSAGITHIGIGLSAPTNPSDFSLLRGTTAGGGTCGVEPANGAFFPADNVGGLFAAFREALAIGGETIGETRAGDPFQLHPGQLGELCAFHRDRQG